MRVVGAKDARDVGDARNAGNVRDANVKDARNVPREIAKKSRSLWSVVFGRHASREVKLHAVYCVCFVGFSERATA